MEDTSAPEKTEDSSKPDNHEREREEDTVIGGEGVEMEEERGEVEGEDDENRKKDEMTVKLEDEEERKLALSQKIYRTIVQNILPNLQEVLTKKVRCVLNRYHNNSLPPPLPPFFFQTHIRGFCVDCSMLQLDLPGHKFSHQMESDTDSEVLRIPVAMAMTKLLLVLPEERLHTQLPK